MSSKCPQCGRDLKAPELFTKPKGAGWKILCPCGFQIISDEYKNFVTAGLAAKVIH